MLKSKPTKPNLRAIDKPNKQMQNMDENAGLFVIENIPGNITNIGFPGEPDGRYKLSNPENMKENESDLSSTRHFPGNFGLYLAAVIFCLIVIAVPAGLFTYRRILSMKETKRLRQLATFRMSNKTYEVSHNKDFAIKVAKE